MLIAGFLMIDAGIAMIVGAFFLPEEAQAGLFAGGAAVLLSGAFMMYLSWPSKRKPPREGLVKADAFVVDAKLAGTEAVGYRMVEMTLDVRPKDGVPFQVTRKFVADMPGIEPGEKFEVYYDPADPEKVELA